MSHLENVQWSFDDELYELRFWNLQLPLDDKWQSAASDMLKYRKSSTAVSTDQFEKKSSQF